VVAVVLVVATAMAAEVVVMVVATVVAPAAARVALVAGATGLVGQAVLAGLLTDKHYTAVHAVGRRPLALVHPKLTSHGVDFSNLTSLPGIADVDDVFITLGTTIKVAGSEAAFRAIDFDAVLAVARAARQAGAGKLGVISAMGANSHSSVFYNRVKGEMEAALQALDFPVLVIARPSLLTGNRAALNQATRPGEHLGGVAMRLFKPLIPPNYQAISAQEVGQALLSAVKTSRDGTHILLSGALRTGRKPI
jgi:uncharacterized protein YbjT (DUF2867 family)